MTYTRRVGVFISNSHLAGQGVLQGVSHFCQMKGDWKMSIAVGEQKNMLAHLADHLDGIIAGVQNAQVAKALKAWGKPFVDVFGEFTSDDSPRVCTDSSAAIGRLGAEHLLSLGFKHFAFCGFLHHGSSDSPSKTPSWKRFGKPVIRA